MIKIQRFVCNMLQENCYVLSDESGECVVVDCGAWFENERKSIVDYIHNNLTVLHNLRGNGHIIVILSCKRPGTGEVAVLAQEVGTPHYEEYQQASRQRCTKTT